MAINKSFKNKTFYCQKSLSCFTAKQIKIKNWVLHLNHKGKPCSLQGKEVNPQKDFAPNLKKKKSTLVINLHKQRSPSGERINALLGLVLRQRTALPV